MAAPPEFLHLARLGEAAGRGAEPGSPLCLRTTELCADATIFGGWYPRMQNAARGLVLSRMLVSLTHLYEVSRAEAGRQNAPLAGLEGEIRRGLLYVLRELAGYERGLAAEPLPAVGR